MDQLKRCFLAIELSESIKKETLDFVVKIKSQYPNFRFIPPENWHLTLHFFGSISLAQIERIKDMLPKVLEQAQSFPLFLEGMGAFPSQSKARILWLGVSGDDSKLLNLKKQIDSGLQKMRFEIEKRSFHPHLTIARLKGERPVVISNLPVGFRTKTVDSVRNVTLFESQLSSGGASYQVLHVFCLSAS